MLKNNKGEEREKESVYVSFVVGHYLIQYIFKLYILIQLLSLILSLVCCGVGGEGYVF